MTTKFTGRALLTHLFFFFFFLVLPGLVFQRLPGESMFTLTRVIVQDTIANFILLCFFYLNYYVLIPKYYFTGRFTLYVVLVVLFLIITLPLPHLLGKFLPDNLPGPPSIDLHGGGQPPPGDLSSNRLPGHAPLFDFPIDEFRRHLYLFFTAVFFSFLLRTREHLSQLKEEKLHAELSSLKAQINPHFLFNTLNSIYVLSVKKDSRASDAIIHLSGLMRYVIKDANDHTIPLQKEIDYITDYVELQKARLGNTTIVKFDIDGEPGTKKIVPLILITYIENAFKYGVNPEVPDSVIDIRLAIEETAIRLQTFNKKMQFRSVGESTGIGMANTNERLNHLYPQKHHLDIKEDEQTFSLSLSIELT